MKQYCLKRIACYNFRSYDEFEFHPTDRVNLIQGDNRVGKTNLLEAIFLLSSLKSHRTNNLHYLIRHGCQGFRLEADISCGDRNLALKLIRAPDENSSRAYINGKKQDSLLAILGMFRAVLFVRDDITIINGEPADRRAWLDALCARTDPLYLDTLKRFKRVLQQRNLTLRRCQELNRAVEELAVWDDEYNKYCLLLTEARQKKIMILSRLIVRWFHELSDARHDIQIVYQPNYHLTQRVPLSVEISRGRTLYGPHHDDILFLNDNLVLKYCASEGEKRLLALSIKLAEIDVIVDQHEVGPVLLFDDTFLELDAIRRKKIIDVINPDCQALITGTGFNDQDFKDLDCSHWLHTGREPGRAGHQLQRMR